jgi:stage II sporulation protein D
MKKVLFISLLLMFLASPLQAAQTIKVLILDKGFNKIPEKDEKLTKIDSVRGRLKLGDTNYTGNIEVWRGKNGLYLINVVPLEEYVEGVVKAETGSDWALEALKAQAVIVRTYVLNNMLKNNDRVYHVTSSVLHQIYRGLNSDTNVSTAVRRTMGRILTHEGKPIMAFYHSSSSGRTEKPEEVFGSGYQYLKSVSASGKLSPYDMWTRRIPIREVEKATNTKRIIDVKIKKRTSTGRAKDIALFTPRKGSKPSNKTVKAKDLRKMLGWKRLPSTDFSLKVQDGIVVFEGKGYGHGVGLCQWTALEMALQGKDYKAILSHFYPGAKLDFYEDFRL